LETVGAPSLSPWKLGSGLMAGGSSDVQSILAGKSLFGGDIGCCLLTNSVHFDEIY
jgi:hypothetical protein